MEKYLKTIITQITIYKMGGDKNIRDLSNIQATNKLV